MSSDVSIKVRFHPPPEGLRRYFTTFYITEIRVPEGQRVTDSLQPEWANLRFFSGSHPESWFNDGPRLKNAAFTATGPSTRNCNFSLGSTRSWGVGLLPLGWARFMPEPAADHANLITDGCTHPAFAAFRPLAHSLFGEEPDERAELERISTFFENFEGRPLPDEDRILAIHAALIDPTVDTVCKVVKRAATSQRTVERICRRAFGFSPKVLLRRQRFMRSLAQFMLDPSLKWIGAIDSQYHDQAQFVRDFHEFMGQTPREYATTPHPVLERFMHERARAHGAAVQTMDRPDGNSAAQD